MVAEIPMIGARHEAALVLYELGWSDVRIGAGLTLNPKRILRWRKDHGLPRAASTITNFPHQPCQDLYEQGLTDAAIGRALGRSDQAIFKWRRRRHLPANRPASAPVTAAERRQIRRLLRQGLTVQHVAEDTGRCRATIDRERTAIADDSRLRHAMSARCNRREALACPDLLERVRAALPRRYAADITDEAEGNMVADLIDGRLAIGDIKAKARAYLNAAVGAYASRYGPSSLDEELGEEGYTLGSILVDETTTDWMHSALERAWQGPLA